MLWLANRNAWVEGISISIPFLSLSKKQSQTPILKNYLQRCSIGLVSCILPARLQRSESFLSSAYSILHLHPDVELLFELLFSFGNCGLLGIPVSWWESSGTSAEESEEFGFSLITAGKGRGVPGGGLGSLERISGDLLTPLEFSSNLVPLLFLPRLVALLAI